MSTSEHEQRRNENDQVAGTNKDTTARTNKRKRVRPQRQEQEQAWMSARVNERSEWWAHTFAEGGHTCNTSGGHSNNSGGSTTSTGSHNSSGSGNGSSNSTHSSSSSGSGKLTTWPPFPLPPVFFFIF